MNDKAPIDLLRGWMGTKDSRALRLASEEDAATSLRRLMVEEESTHPEVDSERLGSAVFALEWAGKRCVPAVAIAWLQERPSHARLGVVLCVLAVSWSRSPDVPPPDPALVEALLSIYRGLPRDVINENGLLIVLMSASRAGLPAPLAAEARSILERARETPHRAPGVTEMLDAFLNSSSSSSPTK